jgi:hypothetical protein
MKWLILIGLLILSACARTEVVYYPAQIKQTAIHEPEQKVSAENIEIPEASQLNTVAQNRTIQTQQIEDDEEQESDFDASEEYTVTSCCSEGRLYAQAKNERNDYSEEEIKNLLIEIYHNNCDEFNQIRQLVYLRFKNENQDSSYLVHYKNSNIEKILIDLKDTNYTFEVCN